MRLLRQVATVIVAALAAEAALSRVLILERDKDHADIVAELERHWNSARITNRGRRHDLMFASMIVNGERFWYPGTKVDA